MERRDCGSGRLARLSRLVFSLDDVLKTLFWLSLFVPSSCSVRPRVERQTSFQGPPAPTCDTFVRGNESKKEFYSPGWPNPYPEKILCVRTISAPEGYVIQVDFRDRFDLEYDSKCEHDFLLVRDGEETYSRQLARICGHKMPSRITSSGNHLWLRFKSDESIQYGGFRALYTFFKVETYTQIPRCRFPVSGPETIISTANISKEIIQEALDYGTALDCSWRISVSAGRQIQISFPVFTLNKPNECELNFVEILHGPKLSLKLKARFCSSKADSVKLPNSEDVTFRFYADPVTLPSLLINKSSVTSVVTELRLMANDEQCKSEEFDCDDLYCIDTSLVCNGNDNCDKQLDEKGCEAVNGDSELLTTANIVIMVIGAALLFGLCFSICWNCIRKLREDIREKEEYVRQSQEGGLDTVPRMAPHPAALDEGNCYVPSRALKALAAADTNGGGRVVREDTIDLDVDTTECSCQTQRVRLDSHDSRDSRDSGGSGASTPPPPPPQRPPASPLPGYSRWPPPGYGPAGDGPPTRRQHGRHRYDGDRQASGSATPRSYRSEAVIDMGTRPKSLHSAKSAPDVIVKL